MFEKFFHENSGDFRQRYEGTYGFFVDETGTRMLTKILAIDQESSPRAVHFVDERGVTYTLYADVAGNIGYEFLPPKSMFHNTEYGVYYTQRRAARQFKRGVCSENTTIFRLLNGSFEQVRVDFPQLKAIYSRPVSFDEAFARYKAKLWQSVALSKNFSLVRGKGVYLLTELIASVGESEDGKYHIKVAPGYSAFTTELRDAFNRVGLHNMEITNE